MLASIINVEIRSMCDSLIAHAQYGLNENLTTEQRSEVFRTLAPGIDALQAALQIKPSQEALNLLQIVNNQAQAAFNPLTSTPTNRRTMFMALENWKMRNRQAPKRSWATLGILGALGFGMWWYMFKGKVT